MHRLLLTGIDLGSYVGSSTHSVAIFMLRVALKQGVVAQGCSSSGDVGS